MPFAVAVLLVAAAGVYLVRGDYPSVLYSLGILFLTQAPRLLKRWQEFYLPLELDAAIGLFIFLSLFLGALQNFYNEFDLYDSFVHFQSGFLLGIAGFVLFYIFNGPGNKRLRLTPLFISFSAFNFSVAAGALWEVYEYIADSQFGYNMQQGGLPDTMWDIMLNAMSAALVAAIGYVWMRRHGRIPLTPQKLEEEASAPGPQPG
jgi:hypothetical protein